MIAAIDSLSRDGSYEVLCNVAVAIYSNIVGCDLLIETVHLRAVPTIGICSWRAVFTDSGGGTYMYVGTYV